MEITLTQSHINASFRDYLTLLKPRVMSLVVFTGMVGMMLAPGHLRPVTAFLAILCIALGGGAAGAINMWLERDSDALMERTRSRPIPAGRISAASAFDFAIICAVSSVSVMAIAVNYLAAALLLGTIFFYVFVYTLWLKPRSPISIVIGGAAGALPPVIGWAAATGDITFEPLVLFLIIFLWTPPHFWALALTKKEDYMQARIPTLPVVAGVEATMRQMFIYTVLLLFASLAPYAFGMAGLLYFIGAEILGSIFIFYALRLWQRKNLSYAMPMFRYSLLYLFAIFALLLLDKIGGV